MKNNLQRVSGISAGGFTLVEMLVALGIFSIVMLVAVSALLSVVDLNRKAQAAKSVMNNLNFALESMSREIRVGSDYLVGFGSATSQEGAGDTLQFQSPRLGDAAVEFQLSEGKIVKRIDGDPFAGISLTAPEVTIENAVEGVPLFSLAGGSPADTRQPFVVIRIVGRAGSPGNAETRFTIQTTVSQRMPDR